MDHRLNVECFRGTSSVILGDFPATFDSQSNEYFVEINGIFLASAKEKQILDVYIS